MNIIHNIRNFLFPHRLAKQQAMHLYAQVLEQSRNPESYVEFAVPDTQDGRFGFVSLHMYILLKELKGCPDYRRVSQELVDLMFDDMDSNLRVMGVGDLGVGRRMKLIAKAFYGGLQAYEKSVEGSDESIESYLDNNIYQGNDQGENHVSALKDYIFKQVCYLKERAKNNLFDNKELFISGKCLNKG